MSNDPSGERKFGISTELPFSKPAEPVLKRAIEKASANGRPNVGTQYLLYSLALNPKISVVLQEQGIDTVLLESDPRIGKQPERGGYVPFSDATQKVLNIAQQQARASKSKQITPSALMRAILLEGNGVAINVLDANGMDFKKRAQLLVRLQQSPQ